MPKKVQSPKLINTSEYDYYTKKNTLYRLDKFPTDGCHYMDIYMPDDAWYWCMELEADSVFDYLQSYGYTKATQKDLFELSL